MTCATCGLPRRYRGTYKSKYGFRYRRYECLNGHKWREDMERNVIEVKRGRLTRQEENRYLLTEPKAFQACALEQAWRRA
jgi:hypothetical protein